MYEAKVHKIRGRIDKFLVIVGVYHIPFSIDNKTRRHKISKDIGVKSTVNNFNLIDTERILHPTMKGITVFSNTCETYTKKKIPRRSCM